MISYICPPIAVRILDNGVRVDLATGLGVLVPVPSGPPGRQGPKGDTGAGVPPGGSTGQYLRKASSTDYDGEWSDLPAPPVTSVNGKTGAVELDAEDVGALPDTTPLFSGDYDDLRNKPTIPTKVSDLQNDSGFVNAAGAAAAAPVQDVNGQTGNVSLNAPDVGAMSKWVKLWENASPTSDFAAQTVPLDLTGYDFVAIEHHLTLSDTYDSNGLFISIVSVGTDGILQEANYQIAWRVARVSTNGIQFFNGRVVTTLNQTVNINNAHVKPTRIWGIKGVVNT